MIVKSREKNKKNMKRKMCFVRCEFMGKIKYRIKNTTDLKFLFTLGLASQEIIDYVIEKFTEHETYRSCSFTEFQIRFVNKLHD